MTFTTPMTARRADRRRERPGHGAEVSARPRRSGAEPADRGAADGSGAEQAEHRHRLGPGGRVVLEQPAHRGGDRERARLAHAAHRHAQVLGLDQHERAARRERVDDRVGDLGREPFLHLRPLREAVDEPRDLRQAGDAAVVAGDVRDVRAAVERQRGGARRSSRAGCRARCTISSWSASNVTDRGGAPDPRAGRSQISRVHLRDAVRRAQQAVAVGIFADREQELADRLLDARERRSPRRRPSSASVVAHIESLLHRRRGTRR